MIVKPDLTRKPTVERFRGPICRGLSVGTGEVKPNSGLFGAGLIQGMAVVTRGEALGHGMWLDSEFVDQTQAALDRLTRASGKGAKARFTHPDMSSDGLGKALGRVRYGKRDGDILRGNLHFYRAAHEAPDGDLAKYVMSLADEDPAGFGASIVFVHDWEAELQFALEHGAQAIDDEYVDYSTFQSPDPDNVNHYPHARLAQLLAVDVVDDPAANPDGLFYRDPIFVEAEATAAYALGLSAEAPALQALSVDPHRVQVFVKKFLDRHNLQISPKTKEGPPVTDSAATEVQTAVQTEAQPDFRAELKRFREAFGQQGVLWCEEGMPYDQAAQLHAAQQAARAESAAELATVRAEVTRLQTALNAAKQEAAPVSATAAADANDQPGKGKVTLRSLIRIRSN